jgi:uncharacterized membrane protein YfcA
MLDLYLPIAALSIKMPVILAAGAAVGFLSGLFGVGGGFLITPLLMFLGIPPDAAIASGAAQAAATSVSGAASHWKRGNVDARMGGILVVSGFVGSTLGGLLAVHLRKLGHFEVVVALSYVILLGVVGGLMLLESARALTRNRQQLNVPAKRSQRHNWTHGLRWRMRFPVSRLYISLVPVIAIGTFVGFMSAIMGVGGGFVLVPAMVYVLAMRTNLAVGTSAFQIVFVTSYTTILLAVSAHSLDVLLSLLLIVGGVVGTQIGTRAGARLNGEQLRFLLALLILAVGVRVGVDLVRLPEDFFSLREILG